MQLHVEPRGSCVASSGVNPEGRGPDRRAGARFYRTVAIRNPIDR